jgi:large subunit ribosomal protein L24
MKIKKGDLVEILGGKDQGKRGRVLKVIGKSQKAVVEGLNLFYKHVRPKREGEKGQRIQVPVPVYLSKLGFVCPKCSKTVRIGYKVLTDGKKVRWCRKCREIL